LPCILCGLDKILKYSSLPLHMHCDTIARILDSRLCCLLPPTPSEFANMQAYQVTRIAHVTHAFSLFLMLTHRQVSMAVAWYKQWNPWGVHYLDLAFPLILYRPTEELAVDECWQFYYIFVSVIPCHTHSWGFTRGLGFSPWISCTLYLVQDCQPRTSSVVLACHASNVAHHMWPDSQKGTFSTHLTCQQTKRCNIWLL